MNKIRKGLNWLDWQWQCWRLDREAQRIRREDPEIDD